MKVIKKGILKEKEIKKTCGYCNCKFEYSKEDIHYDTRDGNYVICPTCEKFLATSYIVQVDRSRDC